MITEAWNHFLRVIVVMGFGFVLVLVAIMLLIIIVAIGKGAWDVLTKKAGKTR